ncbi:MAG TPA: SDR family oxidoreductase [Bryobacteraceae bacterium]|nr:SDR family oxidoreductase [Bryobacteraceae bacterium]
MFDFTAKSIVVTGGTSGIGRAIARAFSEAGANVIAAGLPSGEGPIASVDVEIVDVADGTAIAQLFEKIPEVDVLVNAAGIIRREEEFGLDVFAQVIDVNLTGVMRASMAARPKLAKTKGCIVNIASMLSFFGAPRAPAYSASKGGIAQLTRSLAVAWAADGIRVNAVAPGWIATPLTRELQNDAARSDQLLARTPFRRWGLPNEVAGPVLFLSSEAASFVTGAILTVDGGYSAA